MLLAQLTLAETIAAGAVNVLLTALLVGGLASLLVKNYEARAAEWRREADQRHQEVMQARELEYQAREALREIYKQLLVAQRRSRQVSLELSRVGGATNDSGLARDATSAHSDFIDLYHSLNLDASRDMWKDARALRNVLDDMHEAAQAADAKRCEQLYGVARLARQNLERSFRSRLGYEPLQKEQDLGDYKKD